MTYKPRGRTLTEVIIAVIFLGFVTGFVAVLCIGNYFRAKRAAERQRQTRLARLAGGAGHGVVDSPRSYRSGSSNSQVSSGSNTGERQHLLGGKNYFNVPIPKEGQRRRHPAGVQEQEGTDSLLLNIEQPHPPGTVMSV